MKIAATNPDFARIVENQGESKSHASLHKGEVGLDPQNRSIDQQPVEAVEQSQSSAAVFSDPVRLSPEAKAMRFGQEEIEKKITERLHKRLEAKEIDLSDHQGMDYAPDAVAQRIVDYSVQLYGVFREKHPGLSDSEAKAQFGSQVQSAVDDGFSRAMDEITKAGLPEGIAELGKRTKAIIDHGLNEYFSHRD